MLRFVAVSALVTVLLLGGAAGLVHVAGAAPSAALGPAARGASAAPALSPGAVANGTGASLVLGQPDLTNNSSSTTAAASNFLDPGYALAFDASGDLWVADWGANRVLEFVPPFSTNMSASLVLGQSTFAGKASGTSATNLSEPDGLAFDPSGNLWVAEYGNNRIVEFPYPFSTGEAAALVLGQASFTTRSANSGPTGLSGPGVPAFRDGDLWVADYRNNRVVEYPAPLTTGEAATLVLGQPNLTASGAGTSAVALFNPGSVAFDPTGNLWVADEGNDRALEFLAPLSTGEAASVVLGQSSFTTSSTPGYGSFYEDNGIFVDGSGNVWVADSGNNRVLEFTGPAFVNDQPPSAILGQANLTGNTTGAGPAGLAYPTAVARDPHGNIWVDDESNYRVLMFGVASSSSGSLETLLLLLGLGAVVVVAVVVVLLLRRRAGRGGRTVGTPPPAPTETAGSPAPPAPSGPAGVPAPGEASPPTPPPPSGAP